MNNVTKYNHPIPKSYLKQFSDNDIRIFVFKKVVSRNDRLIDKPISTSTKKIFCHESLYLQTTENKLATEMDRRIGDDFPKINKNSFQTKQEKDLFYKDIILTMHSRTIDNKKKIDSFVYDEFQKILLDLLSSFGQNKKIEKNIEELWDKNVKNELHGGEQFWLDNYSHLTDFISKLNWQVHFFNDAILTSDNPVILTGINSVSNLFITLPISKNKILTISPKKLKSNDSLRRLVNKYTIVNSHKFIYSQKNESDWIKKILKKSSNSS